MKTKHVGYKLQKFVDEMVEKSDYSMERVFYIAGMCFRETTPELCYRANKEVHALWKREYHNLPERENGNKIVEGESLIMMRRIGTTLMVGVAAMLVHAFSSDSPLLKFSAGGAFAATIGANESLGLKFTDLESTSDANKFSDRMIDSFERGYANSRPENN